jgi:hypothetical protein
MLVAWVGFRVAGVAGFNAADSWVGALRFTWTLTATAPAKSGSGTNVSYTSGALASGVWYFRVSAFNAGGDSPFSNVVSLTI